MWYFIIGCFVISACLGESLHADISNNYRVKREQPAQQQEAVLNINYRPYNQVPDRIKQLVTLQQTPEPVVFLPQKRASQLQGAASAPGVHRSLAPQPILQSAQPLQSLQPIQPPQPSYQPQQYPQQQQQQQPAQPLYQPLSIPLAQHQPQQQAQPLPSYNPKIEYNAAPKQLNYKGIQAIQAGTQQGPLPLHGQSLANQETYVPQYKTGYTPQQQQLLQPGGKGQWNSDKGLQPNLVYRPVDNAPPSGWTQPQSQGQFPKNLPANIRKIIENQRSYQG